MITAGKIGHVMQGQTSYYRNSDGGQWRYYHALKDMNPKTVDWKMFLGTDFGLAPDKPFNRAKYAQWRCYWDFGGGMYTDLFVHQLTHLIQAMGVRFPRRVVGAGGLYLEYDGRDVPDMATVVADYDEGCQVMISATMCNDVQLGEVIRGHTGDDRRSIRAPRAGFRSSSRRSRAAAPPGANRGEGGEKFAPAAAPRGHPGPLGALHRVHPLAEPGDPLPGRPGYAAITTVNLGVQSYREGKAYYFDKETGKVSDADGPGPRGGKSGASSAASRTRSRLEGRRRRLAVRRPTTRSSKATGSTARTLRIGLRSCFTIISTPAGEPRLSGPGSLP